MVGGRGGCEKDGAMAPDEALGPVLGFWYWDRAGGPVHFARCPSAPPAAVEGGDSRGEELGFGQKFTNVEKWPHLRIQGLSEKGCFW